MQHRRFRRPPPVLLPTAHIAVLLERSDARVSPEPLPLKHCHSGQRDRGGLRCRPSNRRHRCSSCKRRCRAPRAALSRPSALLTEQLKTEVILSNDLSAAAWGEFKFGAGRGEDEVYTVFVGTGVGSAIISSGRLLHGASGVAGELGHIKVMRDGRQCGCGQHGCLEAYAGGAGLAAWMQDEGLTGNAGDLERLVESGSAKAKQLFDFVTQSLGVAIANQVTVLNPGRLVLGGGVLMNSPRLTEQVVAHVKSTTGARAAARVQIKMAALGDDSGLIGAALLAAG